MMMKYGGSKRGLALALVLTLFPAGAAAAQAPAGGATKEEAAEAQAAAAAFARRLRATQDFAQVARELYAEDFMSRQLKGLDDRAGRARLNTFMLGGVPSLAFERSLASKANVGDWRRVRVAADNILYFMFLSLLSGHSFEDLGDPEKFEQRSVLGVFPPEALKALGANPSASNFLSKKESEVVIRTPEEMRAVAAALEEAVRLARPRLAESLAKGKHLDANLGRFEQGLPLGEIRLVDARDEGYPEGTRLFKVLAPNAYVLILVRQGGVLKVVWAGMPSD